MSSYLTIADAMALEAKCPLCKASPGRPCVYMADKVKRTYNYHTGITAATVVSERGTPTKRVHNDRRERVWKKIMRADREAYQKAHTDREPSALFALRAFDVAEYNQTKEWLRANHRLFRLRLTDPQ